MSNINAQSELFRCLGISSACLFAANQPAPSEAVRAEVVV
jgi:hypothetical protein